jgi:predicted thioredoxin/glutaredoxin
MGRSGAGAATRPEIRVRLTIVHRQDCELCDLMVAELTALGRREALPPLELVDVDADPVLQRRHGLNVPVLLLDGTVVCRQRLDIPELLRILRAPLA